MSKPSKETLMQRMIDVLTSDKLHDAGRNGRFVYRNVDNSILVEFLADAIMPFIDEARNEGYATGYNEGLTVGFDKGLNAQSSKD
jgi:hypothetical protein